MKEDDGLASIIARPLDVVRRMFDAADQPAEDRSNDWGVEEFFTKMLSDPVTREQVSSFTGCKRGDRKFNQICELPIIIVMLLTSTLGVDLHRGEHKSHPSYDKSNAFNVHP